MNDNGTILTQELVTFEQFLGKNLPKIYLLKNDQFAHGYIQ